jgi:hypothetical protein
MTAGSPPDDADPAARRNVRWIIGGQSASMLGDNVAILALPLFA